jgi:hypothetical protein
MKEFEHVLRLTSDATLSCLHELDSSFPALDRHSLLFSIYALTARFIA